MPLLAQNVGSMKYVTPCVLMPTGHTRPASWKKLSNAPEPTNGWHVLPSARCTVTCRPAPADASYAAAL